MVRAKSNETARMHFTVFDTDGLTPLTGQAGNCTDSLLYNGATSGQAVTIVEIGVTGHYIASFTPNAVGDWDLEVTCPDDRVVGESFEVEGIDLDDLNNLSSADIQTVLENNDLDHVAGVASAGNPTKNTFLDRIMSASAVIDGYDRITDSLETLGATLAFAGPIIVGIDAKTTNLPADPASETNVDANETKIDAMQTDMTEALSRLLRVLALTNENVVIEHTFDANGDHTGWISYCYDSKINADTHDKSTGLLYTYQMSVTYDVNDNPTITKIVRLT